MTCSRCENLDEYVRFRTRGELFRAIGTVRQAVSAGDIEEIDAEPRKGTIAFCDLPDAGPLDDDALKDGYGEYTRHKTAVREKEFAKQPHEVRQIGGFTVTISSVSSVDLLRMKKARKVPVG